MSGLPRKPGRMASTSAQRCDVCTYLLQLTAIIIVIFRKQGFTVHRCCCSCWAQLNGTRLGAQLSESSRVSRSHAVICSMGGRSCRIVGADALKIDRTILSCSMYWGAIAQLCNAGCAAGGTSRHRENARSADCEQPGLDTTRLHPP